jgi:uncharacterized surface protein with fasciclin (FAS1) repeats
MKYNFLSLVVGLVCLFACTDDNFDGRFSTFEEKTVATFLKDRPELFSTFTNLIDRVGLLDLLNAYGTYTCFAPTNEAFEEFFKRNEITDTDKLTDDEVKEIVYQHIISRKILTSTDFPSGAIFFANLDNRFLVFSFNAKPDGLEVLINEKVRIIQLDNKVHNGIIHTVDRVIEPDRTRMAEVIASLPQFSLFHSALVETGLIDSMSLYRDDNYEAGKIAGFNSSHPVSDPDNPTGTIDIPNTRLFGYTAFIESDDTYSLNGISNLDDMKKYAAEIYDEMYPEDRNRTDPKDRRNSLNRFVAYHIMDRMQAENEFIGTSKEMFIQKGTPLYEYMEMMAPNTLMECTNYGGILTFNRHRDGSGIHIVRANIPAENGYVHEIDRILTYDKSVENDVLNKRIRMDALSMYPEMVTNKLRYQILGNPTDKTRLDWTFPVGYLKGVSWQEGEGKNMIISATNYFGAYLGDEFQFHKKWDFTMRLPPIPAGTYEVRLKYISWTYRAVSQLYFDGKPCGIPLDMRFDATNARIGWINDNETEDEGLENDKMMHNRGYMKGSDWNVMPESNNLVERNSAGHIRRIITTVTFDRTEPHYFRAKNVLESAAEMSFHGNYFEFIPIHLLMDEDKH